MSHHQTLESLFLSVAETISPPEDLTVAEAAERYRILNNPGSYSGPWLNSFAPYLVEPMEALTSLNHTGMVFVGPARTGKSDMFFNWLTHTAKCDPADMLLVHMTQASARDWSQGDLRKAFRHSPALGERVIPGRQNMNVHDVGFKSGMRLLVKWPTITELSGKTVPRVWLMDYDRMTQDVDGEGPAFDLGRKRTGSFKRYGMTVAESSPGMEISNPRWLPTTPHEAPPTNPPGILGLYNRGDRRRFNWRCAVCKKPFEGDFKHFKYPDSKDLVEASEMTTLDCPHCGYSHTHDAGPGQPGKDELNFYGRWVKDGCVWLPDGSMGGTAVRSDIQSFWLKGPAAAFTTWPNLVHRYLSAYAEYEKTGDTGALKATVNTDQGHAFLPPALQGERLPEDLKDRAEGNWMGMVPHGVRFLVACIDIQGFSFVVQVHGIGVGGDVFLINRFTIKESARRSVDNPNLIHRVQPDTHAEDWRLLVDQVIEKSYPLADGSGRAMSPKVIVCDSGGKEGVTFQAYNFWRWLRHDHKGNHHRRFQLVKGIPRRDAPAVKMAYPNSERRDRRAAARGEVPVLEINSNMLKDQVYAMLGRTDPFGGMVHFPKGLQNWFFAELTAENRTTKGWENLKKLRNEAWDLLYYCVAACQSSDHVGIDTIDWEDPPEWASDWATNTLVFSPAEKHTPFEEEPAVYDLSKLGETLG